MIIITLIVLTIVALAIDWFIFKHFVSRIKYLRVAYIIQALIIDVGVLYYFVSSLFFKTYSDKSITILALWLVFTFIMSFSAKFIFALFALIEMLAAKITGRRVNVLLYSGLIMSISVVAVMTYGATIGRSDIRVEHVTINSAHLPDEFDGFKIAQFSDAHLGNIPDTNPLMENVVSRINSLNPDIVVQTGDLVNIHSGELNDHFMKTLSGFNAPVYSILGNHDLAYYIHDQSISPQASIRELIDKQRAMGWDLLINENRWLHRGQDSIALVGVVYPKDGRLGVNGGTGLVMDLDKAFDGVSDSPFTVLLSHTPSLFDSVPQVIAPNLTISGHVHSMQMKFTIGDYSWSPAKWLYPMWSGLWVDRGHYLYVNDGVGYVLYPMRIGAKPEITLFELKKIKNS